MIHVDRNCAIATSTRPSKIVLLVADGLGGLPHPDTRQVSELETAYIPNLDALAQRERVRPHHAGGSRA